MAKLQKSSGKQRKNNKPLATPNAALKQWEDIFQAIGHPTFILRPDHSIIAYNKAVAALIGKSAKQLIGKKCCDIFHQKDVPPENCPMEKLLRSGHFETVEMVMEAVGRTFLVSCTPVFDKTGALDRIIHIATDITEQKNIQEKLHEKESQLRLLFETGVEGILVADLKKRKFKYANPAICRMLGYTESELKQMGLRDIHPPESEKYNIEQFDSMARGEKTLAENIPCLRKDGTIIYAHIAGTKGIMDGEECNIGFFTDVTHIRNIQEKLQDNQQRLRALAAELSHAEEHERRRIAMGIHDNLGQKLAMTKLKLEILKESSREEDTRIAIDSACRMFNEMIEDTRSLIFELSNPILYEIGLEDAVSNLLKNDIQDKGGLNYKFVSDCSKIELDEDTKVALFKAIRELLINILKHARAKNVKAVISRRNHEVQVTVEDDGAGFDTGKLGLPSSKRGGFGLFNIKEQLEYRGGRLEIESRKGKGTRVVLTIPIKKQAGGRERTKPYERADS